MYELFFYFLFVCLGNFWYLFGVFYSWIILQFCFLWCWFFKLHNVPSDLYSLLLFSTATTEIRLWSLYHCSDTLTLYVPPSLFSTSHLDFVHAEDLFIRLQFYIIRDAGTGWRLGVAWWVTTFYFFQKCVKPKSNCKMLPPQRTESGPCEHGCGVEGSWAGTTQFAVSSKIT